MTKNRKRMQSSAKRRLGRAVKVELLEGRALMAGNIFDTPAEPVDLSHGYVEVQGAVEATEARDVYKISLSGQTELELNQVSKEDDSAIQVALYDASGNAIEPIVGDFGQYLSLYGELTDGDYFVVLTGNGASDESYQLVINALSPMVTQGSDPGSGGWVVEPRPDDVDEIGADATELDMSWGYVEMGGTLDRVDDVDVYRFTVGEHDMVSGGGWRLDGGEELSVALFDADGNRVEMENLKESSVSFEVAELAAGEYFLVVSGDSPEPVDYWVHVSAFDHMEPSFPVVEPRPDDVDVIGEDATVLDVSSGYAWTDGMIDVEGDKDVYAFELAEADQVFVSGYAYRIDGTGFQVALFDAEGNEVVVAPETFSGFFELQAGKYYLVVSDAAGDPVGYAVSVSTDDAVWSIGGEVLVDDDTDKPIEDGGIIDEDKGTGGNVEIVMYNAASPADVNGDTKHTPLDALIVINWLNEFGVSRVADVRAQAVSSSQSVENRFVDINNDGQVSPVDALLVINQLNSTYWQQQRADSFGEGEGPDDVDSFAVNVDWIFSNSENEDELLVSGGLI